MEKTKFIGFIPEQDILKTLGSIPWEAINPPLIPYSAVNYPEGYLLTLGSGCASLATCSAEGISYISGIHIFRRDFKYPNAVDLDHYIATSPSEKGCAVYKSPPDIHHHLTLDDTIFNEVPRPWNFILREILQGRQQG